MDNKIKIFTILAFTILAFTFTGCKENDWTDWKTQNEMWLENNKTKEGIQVSSTGLQYRIIADPTPYDACPNVTSTVVCDYKL